MTKQTLIMCEGCQTAHDKRDLPLWAKLAIEHELPFKCPDCGHDLTVQDVIFVDFPEEA